MTSESDPRYADYTLDELRIVAAHADRKRSPMRGAAIDAELARREGRAVAEDAAPITNPEPGTDTSEPRAGKPLDIGRAWSIFEIIGALFG